MARGRRQPGAPVSLFALQDIVTCLMGIMVLVCLFLALQTIGEVAAKPVEAAPDLATLQEEIDRLESMRSLLADEVNVMKTERVRSASLSSLELIKALQRAQDNYSRAVMERDRQLDQLNSLKENVSQLNEAIERGEAELTTLHQSLVEERAAAEIRNMRNVQFIPDAASTKSAHLIEVASSSVRVISLTPNALDREWPSDRAIQGFEQLLTLVPPDREYFVFMIKPSGVALGMDLFRLARAQGFDAGYDALEENARVSEGASK